MAAHNEKIPMILTTINNNKGSSLVESIVVLPILIVFVVGLSVSLLWGWTRLEISVMTQQLLVCEISERPASECRREYQKKIEALPGNWRLLSLVSLDATNQQAIARLSSQIGGFKYVFQTQESSPWSVWRNSSNK